MERLQRIHPEGYPPTAEVYQLVSDFVAEGVCYLIVDGDQVAVTSIMLDGNVNKNDLDKIFACSDEKGELEAEAVVFTGVPVQDIVALLTRAPIEPDVPDSQVAVAGAMSFSFDPTSDAIGGVGAEPETGGAESDDLGTEPDDSEPVAVPDDEEQ
jgi:hypothetical protein